MQTHTPREIQDEIPPALAKLRAEFPHAAWVCALAAILGELHQIAGTAPDIDLVRLANLERRFSQLIRDGNHTKELLPFLWMIASLKVAGCDPHP